MLSYTLFCLVNLNCTLLTSAGQTCIKHKVTSVILLSQTPFTQVIITFGEWHRKISLSNSSIGHRWLTALLQLSHCFPGRKPKMCKASVGFPTTMEDKMNLQEWTSVVVLLQTLLHDDSFMMRDNHFSLQHASLLLQQYDNEATFGLLRPILRRAARTER